MCTVCGCGTRPGDVALVDPNGHGTQRSHEHGHGGHAHEVHGHDHHHHDDDAHDHGSTLASAPLGAVHAPATAVSRAIRIEADILAENGRFASANRRLFSDRGIFAINMMSGPGAGKTSLLVRTVTDLKGRVPVAVLEGDQQTSFDAERIRDAGAPAWQINTGKGCHLDAHMVQHAVLDLSPPTGSLLFIENVGNLVCPAGFDLGEATRVVLLSVTEGEDKPLKYPDMFRAADVLLLTKIDLLPFVAFDVARVVEFARRIKPGIEVLPLSATTGEGLGPWYDILLDRRIHEAAAAPSAAAVHFGSSA